MDRRDKNKFTAVVLLLALIFADIVVWHNILAAPTGMSALYFLDVGQGDSEVFTLPGGEVIMTDAGPDKKVLDALARALPAAKRIDLAIISHPQMDHFNGFNFLLDKYEFGAFILNGRADGPGIKEWPDLIAKIRGKGIPLVTLGAGDKIKYEGDSIDMLSPDAANLDSGELNDTGLVEYIKTGGWKALLLADIGKSLENTIFGKAAYPADIVKIAHHGSKYSSGKEVLRSIQPRAAVIEVGTRNSYGHPAPATLNTLRDLHISIFRTDIDGTIKFTTGGGKLFAEKMR